MSQAIALTPAQRKLIASMQAGAQLRLDATSGTYWLHGLASAPSAVNTRTVAALLKTGALRCGMTGQCLLEGPHGQQDPSSIAMLDSPDAQNGTLGPALAMLRPSQRGLAPSSTRITTEKPNTNSLTPHHAHAVDNDRQAVAQWLNEFRRKANTLASYAREARRFLFWLHTVEIGTLQSFDRQALDRYVAFLANPIESWTRPGPDGWRPLKGPLSANSTRQALIILQGMYSYLLKARKVSDNPLSLMLDKGAPPPRAARAAPSAHAMTLINDWLPTWCEQASSERLLKQRRRDALMWVWLYWTAARRCELAAATFGQLEPDIIDGQTAWWWSVLGKGEKIERIPLDHQAIKALLEHHCMSPEQLIREVREHPSKCLWPRLRRANTNALAPQALSDDVVYEAVVRVSQAVVQAQDSLPLHPIDVHRIAGTTPHDLRAFRNTHMFGQKVPDRHVQRFMRHADFETTLIYDFTEDQHYYRALLSPV